MNRNKRQYQFTLVAISLVILFLFGCASKKSFWGDEKTGFILAYKLDKDQVMQYDNTGSVGMSMEMMGQTMDINIDFGAKYTLKGNGINAEKNLVSKVTIDDMKVGISSMQGDLNPDMSKVKGKSFDLTFTPKGKELDFSGIEDLKIDMGQMSGGEQSIKGYFQDMFSNLPDQPIKIGTTWTSKDVQTTPQTGIEVTTTSESTHKLIGFEKVDGYECLKIESKATGTQEGSGDMEQTGMHLETEGDVETETIWYFAYKKGVLVKAISDVFTEGTFAISGPQNMTIPMTSETKAEIKLITPPPPPK